LPANTALSRYSLEWRSNVLLNLSLKLIRCSSSA